MQSTTESSRRGSVPKDTSQQRSGKRRRMEDSILKEAPPQRNLRHRLFTAIVTIFLIVGVGLAILKFADNGTLQAPSRSENDKYAENSPECFAAPLRSGDRRKDKTKLKIMNFNAEWLFLYGGRGGIRCPSDSCPWGTQKEAMAHLKGVASLLAKMDADVIHLSEVEDCRVLKRLLDVMPEGHGYAPYLVLGKDHATGQNVGFLTRIDPKSDMLRTERRAKFPVPESTCPMFNRGTLGITKHYIIPIDIEDGRGKMIPFLFAGLHFLARPSDNKRCGQREGQASVLRDLIRSVSQKDERVIIMGDYNDYDKRAIGIDNRYPLSAALEVLYESSGSNRTLKNAAGMVPLSERYSCWFDVNQNCRVDGDNERVLIDHILMDSDLKVLQARIHHDYEPTCDDRISDHWPFSVTIEL